MKIVYVDRSQWWGGAEESLDWLATGMAARGREVEIAVDFSAPHQARFRAPVVPRMVRRPLWAAERWRRPPPGLDRLGVILRARALERLLADADILHVNLLRDRSRWDARAARRAGRRVVGHLRQLAHQSMPSADTFALCDGVVAVSDAVAAAARASGCAAPLRMIYDGVAAERFVFGGDRAAARGALGAPAAGPLIGFPAAFEPRKGQDVALDAFARIAAGHPGARLVLAGPDAQLSGAAAHRAALVRRAAAPDLAGRVDILGPCEDMAAFYAACDVVLALSGDGEAFGRVPAEAALAARPVVASRAGATPEVVADGETGLLVSPGDADDAARALDRLLSDPEAAARMGRAAEQRARRLFDPGIALDAFDAFYQEIIAAP